MRGRLLALAVVLVTTAGCATKGDLRDLRDEMAASRATQEELLRELQSQSDAILDSLHVQDVRLRGDLTNRLLQVDRQLVQIQELTGQGQQQLSQLRETVRAREEAFRSGEMNSGETSGDQPTRGGGDPDELFSASRSAMERGSLATARAGFEELVRSFPRHPRAAEAQLAIGVTYEEGDDAVRALEAYGRVTELYPNSQLAATALYRAALLEVARDNREQARSMLSQIIAAYPDSPEAEQATQELRRIRR